MRTTKILIEKRLVRGAPASIQIVQRLSVAAGEQALHPLRDLLHSMSGHSFTVGGSSQRGQWAEHAEAPYGCLRIGGEFTIEAW